LTASPREARALLLVLGVITASGPLSIDIYLPALPTIAVELQAPPGAVQLTLSVFFFGIAFGQMLYGPLADRFGRRPLLLAGLAIFVLAGVGCAQAHSVQELILWRAVQAIGAGAPLVLPRTIVRDLFDVTQTARGLSLLGMISGLAPMLAPLIGGYVLLASGWRAIFLVLAAFATVGIALSIWWVPETVPDARPSSIGPKLWLSVLLDPRFLRYVVPVTLVQAALFTYIADSAFVFIRILGLKPQQFAWLYALNGLGYYLMGRLNVSLVTRFGPQRLLAAALCATACAAFALALVAWSGQPQLWLVAAPVFVFIASLGLIFPNALALALGPFASSAGTASSIVGTLQYLLAASGGALVAILHDGTARPMASIMCATTAAALWMYIRGRRVARVALS
jgi:DHA1 family bicyclomycin/chloramphenicol resistance-like MFS transporter